mmetsp:Transcript_5996/g.8537  ORF Transcript_5996/g.8537 Transcript_5996/m.8537 type:complete len:600 (-) Transcript_5996:190-1989(-)|eukprot:CAMPEP_0194081370 /NCGR_PEP_ID=MMETSP0149-20130528/7169_1 /TAXON_ID=122233 /ORGANISM="Chaetoceros debilis, Strain MM31A-1" /LENGTH=599 /DNA_ID=CAMNT_0038763277 /DNA_START=103 /DNA_END=1902 /DNA_ORIENTATION=-
MPKRKSSEARKKCHHIPKPCQPGTLVKDERNSATEVNRNNANSNPFKNQRKLHVHKYIQKSINSSLPPLKNHMYGIPIKKDILEGTCSGCKGVRDKKAKDEPVLLCDGIGCVREYHLTCIRHIYPALTAVPEGNFYCPDCDGDGESACLDKYFTEVDTARTAFQTSKSFVESCIRRSLLIESGGFITEQGWSPVDPKPSTESTKKMMQGRQFDAQGNEIPPPSELATIQNLHDAAMDDLLFSQFYTIAQKKNQPSAKKPKRKDKSGTNGDGADREMLVGNIIKVYNPHDEVYHNGRIIDWRSALPPGTDPTEAKDMFYGNGLLAGTEYLVRFAAGRDKRKRTLYRWIILEEHSCAVGVTIIMALKEKGRGLNGWKPAQVLYRSCLELIPVRNLISQNHQKFHNWGLTRFFGKEVNIYINLDDEAVDINSEAFLKAKEAKHPTVKTAKNKESALALHSMAMTSARLEIEERRRTFRWHTLPLHNRYHDKALTLINEYSFDLILEERERDMTATSPNMKIEEEEKKEPWAPLVPYQIQKEYGLCPLIQHGLDRQYIESRISDPENHSSLDSMATMKVSVSRKPACVSMALFNEIARKGKVI